jgi:Trypsin
VTIPITVNEDCNDAYGKTGNLTNGINSQYQICMKNSEPIVHGTCEVSHGGGVHQKLHFYNHDISFVYAINSFGDNCGFNTPIVATKVQPYLGWINSVVFGIDNSKLNFSSYDEWQKEMPQPLKVNDNISNENEVDYDVCLYGPTQIRGQCMEASKCNVAHNVPGQNEQLEICTTSPKVLICCPDRIANRMAVEENKTPTIKGCAHMYGELRVKQNLLLTLESGHRPSVDNELVHIGELYVVQNPSDSCYTTLISDQHVITSTKCAAK